MKKNTYKQCTLRHLTGRYQVAWIPEDRAKPNNNVRLRDPESRTWEDGWRVVNVSEYTMDADYIMKRRRRAKFDSLQ